MSKDLIIGIPVKHYSNSFNGSPSLLCKDFGSSNTDTTTYRPDISISRAYQGASSKKLVFDFEDGKDTGEFVQTFVRTKGLDITEIETAEKRVTQIIEDKKEKAKKDKETSDSDKKFLSDLADSIKGASETSESVESSNS